MLLEEIQAAEAIQHPFLNIYSWVFLRLALSFWCRPFFLQVTGVRGFSFVSVCLVVFRITASKRQTLLLTRQREQQCEGIAFPKWCEEAECIDTTQQRTPFPQIGRFLVVCTSSVKYQMPQ